MTAPADTPAIRADSALIRHGSLVPPQITMSITKPYENITRRIPRTLQARIHPSCAGDCWPAAGYMRHSHLVIDHVVLGVSNIATSRTFYEQALAPLGVQVVLDLPDYIGFGDSGRPWFFVATRAPTERVHVAFSAESREVVDAFHAAALAAGGQDNGAPGPRPIYHAHYYGAFVYDPDGNNIEAVCHRPVSGA